VITERGEYLEVGEGPCIKATNNNKSQPCHLGFQFITQQTTAKGEVRTRISSTIFCGWPDFCAAEYLNIPKKE
jgi:hypothetical protein